MSIRSPRAALLGIAAILFAVWAQKLTTFDHAIGPSARLYFFAIALGLLAWYGTYKNKTMLVVPIRLAVGDRVRLGARWSPAVRMGVAFLALMLCIFGSLRTERDASWFLGTAMWLVGLIVMALAFVREPAHPVRSLDEGIEDVEDRTDFRLPPRVEWLIFAGIFLLAAFMRFYRLGDWTTGVHGDEGEAGLDALAIMNGNFVSPWHAGWSGLPNAYFYGIALGMKVFGTDLFGLRMFSTLTGLAMIPFFYLLVRMLLGVRMAIFATVFMAISDVVVHFTKIEINTITLPLCLVAGFYFLFKGLRDKRGLNFVIAGYFQMAALYFYYGGRLSPFMMLAVFAYLLLILPVAGMPAALRAARSGEAATLGSRWVIAARAQWSEVLHYWPQYLLFWLAALAMASPIAVHWYEHRLEATQRPNQMVIFNNVDRMASQHHATHEPLYVGLRWPTPDEIYSISPIVFEQTAISVPILPDGFWARALWGQLTATMSIFTYHQESCSFYTFAEAPVAKPIEAALMFLGLAWATSRWRDTRMAILSIWFWSTLIAGGVLTIDAPYMCRIIGLVPTMAIFAAMPLAKVTAEVVALVEDRRPRLGAMMLTPKAASLATTTLVAMLLVGLMLENFGDYFLGYLAKAPFTDGTGQAVFVQQTNKQAVADGKSIPKYYNLAVHFLYWGYGVNRFLNVGTQGTDMINASNELPIVDNDGRDVVFLIWPINQQYLSTIKEYYPGGEQGDFIYGTGQYARPIFTYYRVSSEQLDERRTVQASYRSGDDDPALRIERAFGSSSDPPAQLSYPVDATWSGQLFTPRFGPYRFHVDSEDAASVSIDGQQVITSKDGDAEIVLARGLHQVELDATLANRSSQAKLLWGQGQGGAVGPIQPGYLWNGPGRGLVATVGPADAGPLTPDPPAAGNPVFMSRVDGFLGFRDAGNAIGGRPATATWTGTLVAPQSGRYAFDVNSSSDTIISIDGQPVVTSLDIHENQKDAAAGIQLDAGLHTVQVKYRWTGGIGFLEVYWTLPSGQREILGPNQLAIDEDTAAAIATQVQSVSQVPPQSGGGATGSGGVMAAPPPVSAGPSYEGNDLSRPLGIGIDADGNVYVGDRGHQRVAVYSPDLQLLRSWSLQTPSGNPPEGSAPPEIADVAVAPDGSIAVVDSKTQRVSVFDSSGTLTKISNGSSLFLASPNGAAFGPDGSLWVADTAHSEIVHVPPPLTPTLDANQRLKPGDPSTQPIEQPLDIVIDPTQATRAYVVDLRGRIFAMGPDGRISAQWALPVSTAEGGSRLAISPDGATIYMTDPERKRIAVLRPATGSLSYIDAAGIGIDEPSAVAVSGDGRLFVLDRAGRIRIVSAADIVASAPGGR